MMNSKTFTLLFVFLTIAGCAVSTTSISHQTNNNFNRDLLGLVLLSPDKDSRNFSLPSITKEEALTLKFDLLEPDFRYLSLKIIHCNADWTKSALQDLEYLDIYNEFPIRNYSFSQTNYKEYTSYSIQIPQVKLSGNYLIIVYDEENDQTIFTRKFSVYDTRVMMSTQIVRPQNPSIRNTHHEINYEIAYRELNIINPETDLKSYIIQNNHWNNRIDPIPPTRIDLGNKSIGYSSFENKNCLPAGNEFRFFDTRRLNNRGLRVTDQYVNQDGPQVFLEIDQNKKGLAYAENFQKDLNGFFESSNNDWLESQLNTEYVQINFQLKADSINGEVYITGRFNDWEQNDQNKMVYDQKLKSYIGSLLMKQGYYNYKYEIKSMHLEANTFEGDHFQTENIYEIFVYYREPGTIYDQLVGYRAFSN